MPSITFSGLASGLPPNLVDQLVEAEKIPIKQVEARKGKSENRLKLVTDLESKISTLKESLAELAGTRSFNDMTVASGEPNIVNGTVDPQSAKTGSWNVEVLELPQRAAAKSNGFPDKDQTQIGVGYFRFETPDGDKDVYIDGDSNTLEKAAQKINNANVGIRASVIKDGEDPDRPYRLLFSGDAAGAEKAIKYPTLYFLDGDQDLYFDGSQEAKNGKIKVDGMEIEIYDTKLADLIPGVTLDLKQSAPGRQVNIAVSENREAVSGKIKGFVDAANGVLGFIQQQNKLDQNTDTSQTLGGDSLLRSVEQRIRRLIQNPQMGNVSKFQRINELGVEFNRQGTLTLSQEKFNKALAEDPDSVRKFFVGDGFSVGFIPSVRREMATLLDGNFGAISNRKRGLQTQIKQMDKRIEDKERQLVKKEQTLREKFARMEESISRMKAQGAAISAQG